MSSVGIRLKNGNNDTLVSDVTYNTVFIGKAAYAGAEYIYPYASPTKWGVYAMDSHFYQITCDTPVIPFICGRGIWASIAYIQKNGSSNLIVVNVRHGTAPPDIYCFAKRSPGPSTTQTGVVLYDSAGAVAFDSGDKVLIPEFVTLVNTPYSGASSAELDKTYEGTTCNTQTVSTWATPNDYLDIGICFACPDIAGAVNSSYSYIGDLYALAASCSGGNVYTQWHTVIHASRGNFQSNPGQRLCIGIRCGRYY